MSRFLVYFILDVSFHGRNTYYLRFKKTLCILSMSIPILFFTYSRSEAYYQLSCWAYSWSNRLIYLSMTPAPYNLEIICCSFSDWIDWNWNIDKNTGSVKRTCGIGKDIENISYIKNLVSLFEVLVQTMKKIPYIVPRAHYFGLLYPFPMVLTLLYDLSSVEMAFWLQKKSSSIRIVNGTFAISLLSLQLKLQFLWYYSCVIQLVSSSEPIDVKQWLSVNPN